MEKKNYKNLDKQVVGCMCYNMAKDKWCKILETYVDYCVVRDQDNYIIHDELREHLYPIFEGVWTLANKDDVCYEINKDVDYPFYCPADDENYYGCELEHKPKENTENKMEEAKEAEYANVSIDRKNVRNVLDTLIKGLEDVFYKEFVPDDCGSFKPTFIKDAIYGMYDTEDDTTLQEIFNLYNDNTPYSVVCDLFDEHFLHICQNNLITPELMKAIDKKTLELLMDDVNCLDYDVLDKIYHNDTETIEEYRKKLGIDAMIDKHLKKAYKVKGIISQRYVVEVRASNWQEAKKKAMEDLSEPFLPTNCKFVDEIVEPKNWENS